MVELIDRVKLLKWIDLQDGIYSISTNNIISYIKEMSVEFDHSTEIEELEDKITELENK